MQVLETLIKEEIFKIKQAAQFAVKYDIQLTIHTPNENIRALTVVEYSVLRDYVNHFSDVLAVTAIFGEGTINHRIVPYNKQLEATIRLMPLANVPEYVKLVDLSIKEYRLKAAIYESSVNVIEGNSELANQLKTADNANISEITFQLVNPVQERIRTQTFGSVIRDCSPMDAIIYILTKHSKIQGIDKMFEVKGVDVEDGYANVPRKHISVPHNTPVVSVPYYINKNVGGLYPTGFQYYLQRNHWYVFSPFNTNRFEKADWTITIINVPKNRMGQLDRTFRTTPSQLILLATGGVKYFRFSDKSKMTNSHGVRFVDSKKITEAFGTVEDNKFVVSRADNVNQFEQADKTSENKHGVVEPTPIREATTRIDNQMLNHMSDIAAMRGAFLQIEWESGAEDFIFPGTPIQYIYLDGNMPVQTYGRVVAVEAYYRSDSRGMIERKFSNTTIISCFVNDTIKSPEMK